MFSFLKTLNKPHKVKFLRTEFNNCSFKILDVGAGNHSATHFSTEFPNCEYYGIDLKRDYNNNDNDFRLMKDFWEKDLTKLEFDDIPNNYFDVIVMSHVIEHLYNGDRVLAHLISKLKKGGVVYVEFPSIKSLTLPSMRESLNFFDDPTHIRIFSIPEILNILTPLGCRPVKFGKRRNWFYIFLMPILIPKRFLSRGYLVGGDFWDLLGFADFIFARKISDRAELIHDNRI
jgi:SAM-dependent methyltransferase